MNNILIYSDDKKQNIVGIINYYKKNSDIFFDVYKKSDNGLKLIDLNGNHIYDQIIDKSLIDVYIDNYIKEYFDGYYCER